MNPLKYKGGYVIQKNALIALLISIAIVLAVCTVAGCTGSSTTSPTTSADNGGSSSGTATAAPGTGDKIAVTNSGDKITISGGKGTDVPSSDTFALSSNAWYIITTKYNGPDTTAFAVDIATQSDIDADQQIGGALALMLGPATSTVIKTNGTYKSTDYKVYLEDASGPWTVEIQKSPTPQPSGQTSFSHKASDSATSVTPYFALKQGTATFTINQHVDTSKLDVPIEVILVNADTGNLATYLTHNDAEDMQTATYDVPADGNYIMEVTCSSDWSISYTE